MPTKLKNNFRLTNVLVRILFVLTAVFANWQTAMASTVLVLGNADILLALLSATLVFVVLMFLLPILVNVVLNWAKIYSLPRAEYCLLVHAFFSLGFFLCGVLNTVYLFTPLAMGWGNVLFPFVSSLVATLLFYKVTAKLYFNDLTKPFYFKLIAIVYLVLAVVLGVL